MVAPASTAVVHSMRAGPVPTALAARIGQRVEDVGRVHQTVGASEMVPAS